MRVAMARLSEFLTRYRWFVLAAWLAVAFFAAPLSAKQTEKLVGGGFTVPGSQSQLVEDALQNRFGRSQAGGIGAVLKADRRASEADRDAAVTRVSMAVAEEPDLSLAKGVEERTRAALRSSDQVVMPIDSTLPPSELTDPAASLRDAIEPGTESDGVTPYLVGQPSIYAGFQELSKDDLEQAEKTGFPIVALILLAVFGSAAAAALPLALGFVAVTVTGALIYLLAGQMEMSVFVTNMASMVGIGVAVDYSLFILARFREEVRAGRSAREARATALETSGLAVTFSGLAVIISLAGLWMVDNQALRSMALGAMIVVAVAVLTATTLLPVLIRLLGKRVEAGGFVWRIIVALRSVLRHRRRRGATDPDRLRFWQRWTERVMKRPVLSATATAAVLLALAVPALSMNTGNNPLQQFPPGHDVRVGAELAMRQTGGASDPVQVVARFDDGTLADPANRAAVENFAADASRDPETAAVAAPVAGEGGAAMIAITPRHSSESGSAIAMVNRTRDRLVPRSQLSRRATVAVGGETARLTDVRTQINGGMWRIIAFVLGFSFLALMVMLRSLFLPLKAIIMNLLSIGAAYGILVAVFQWGWLDGLIGFDSLGALDTLNPPLILAVVFGLSMDYEVFLLSRIRERYEVHGDNRRAVAEGLASSARTISSAALIMTAVFSVFVLTGVPSIKELGVGCAVAIALDATLVRLILVPAAMQLMGRWNWWLPGWLDRILPRLEHEGGPGGTGTPPPEAARA
ncbi:MAG: MMPL family transporter [Solirubrobacterales bacterium]